MKKYKHKQTGEEVKWHSDNYYIDTRTFCIPKRFIEDTNDWQEIIEKDYEILSIVGNNNSGASKGSILSDKENVIAWQNGNAFSKWDIHSIKRLSDGEIFTIGDKVNTLLTFNEEIVSFILDNDDFSVVLKLTEVDLRYLTKVKKPLFTTEDGVDVFDGDNFTGIDKYYILYHCNTSSQVVKNKAENWLYFSTKEKAEEYVLMNKSCLSLNDLVLLFNKATLSIKNKQNIISNIESLVKSKLNK